MGISNVDAINQIKLKTMYSTFLKFIATMKHRTISKSYKNIVYYRLNKMNDYPLAIEPERIRSYKVSSKNLRKSFQLYTFDMIPKYLRSNPYIQTGYRHGLTAKECLIRYSIISNIKSL